MSTLSVDTIQGQTTAATVKLPADYILQVKTLTSDAIQIVNGATFTDFMSLAITPKFSSSKILCTCHITLSVQNNSGGSNQAMRYSGVKLFRGSTQIALNSNLSGSRVGVWFAANSVGDVDYEAYGTHNSSGQFLDSPNTTSATTYKIQIGNSSQSAAYTITNRTPINDDASYTHMTTSQLTLMEIAQ